MKKLRFVVPTMVLAVAMMGAGYAAWTDSVIVTNTVETAAFDFSFKSPASPTMDLSGSASDISTTHITANSVTADGKTATIILDNIYPGINATCDLVIENTSTIPATMTGYELTVPAPALVTCTVTDINDQAFPDGVIPELTDVKIHYEVDFPEGATGNINETIEANISPSFAQATN